jgi:hypothetical protein
VCERMRICLPVESFLIFGFKEDISMKWEEIEKQFNEEWLLIECINLDEDFRLLEGNVLYHNSDMDKVYKKLLELRPKEYTIEYIGNIPEDLAAAL